MGTGVFRRWYQRPKPVQQFVPSLDLNPALPPPDPCTWEGHFLDRGWNTPQDQIDAGYPIYAQPSNSSGSYTEIFDYGLVFASAIFNVDWSLEVVVLPDISIQPSWEFSSDLISWSAIQFGRSAFGVNVRYVRLKLAFSSADDHALAWLSNLHIFVDVKHEMDSGRVVASEFDIDGTVVHFNKAFKDVDSITLTVESDTPITAVYTFLDVPNPPNFAVFVFDTAGIRTTFPVSWKARGIT